MIEVREAIERLLAAVAPLPPELVPLEDALGRTLAEDVRADRDAPASDRSAMDGFAVRAHDLARPGATLPIAGEIRAGGDGTAMRVEPGTCVRITTGAIVPEGADAVVMLEHAVEADGAARFEGAAEAGQHIRRRGEDCRAGDVVAERGSTVRSAEVAALAAVGRVSVPVVRTPRVAVLSTGDEVVEIDRTPQPHQVRNSNAAMLVALLREEGIPAAYLGIAGDDLAGLEARLERGLSHDVLVVTGGVSVGAYDLVGTALTRRGATVLFHKVAMRPGKPILAARCGGALVLGLPGNPVSAFTAFHVFAAPALGKLAGRPDPVRPLLRVKLARPLARRPGRLSYALATLDADLSCVAPVASASSGDLFALARANAFVVVEAGVERLEAGEMVDVLAWRRT